MTFPDQYRFGNRTDLFELTVVADNRLMHIYAGFRDKVSLYRFNGEEIPQDVVDYIKKLVFSEQEIVIQFRYNAWVKNIIELVPYKPYLN